MLEGYTEIRRHRAVVWVREAHRDAVADALVEGRGCEPAHVGGRGTTLRFAYPGGSGIVRQYRRGGLVRYLLADAYFMDNRPRAELEVHEYLYRAGLATPMPLGAAWSQRGPWFQGCYATQEMEAPNLLSLFEQNPDGISALARSCGAVIRRMHDLGVYHADLQVKNLLADAAGGVYIIDFDKASRRALLGAKARARNLLRLRRSLEKHRFPGDFFGLLGEGYGIDALPAWLDRLYRAKGLASDALTAHGAERTRSTRG